MYTVSVPYGPYSSAPTVATIEVLTVPLCPVCRNPRAVSADGLRWLKYCGNPNCAKTAWDKTHRSADARSGNSSENSRENDLKAVVETAVTKAIVEHVQPQLEKIKQSLESAPRQLPLPFADTSPSPFTANVGAAAPVGRMGGLGGGVQSDTSTADIAATLEVTTAKTTTQWSNPILFNMLLSQYAADPRHWDHFTSECFRYGLETGKFPPSLVKQAQAALAAKSPPAAKQIAGSDIPLSTPNLDDLPEDLF